MARELAEHEAPITRPRRTIDWSQFDTGRPWELVQGVDFDQDPKAAAHSARQWGYYHGRKLTIRREKNRLIIFIHPKESDKD